MPDAALIAATLATINASSEFARAPVMRHLLGYLVGETLAGRGDRLKAYSVAVDALGRNADFDAQADSYPRVQVGRLRRMIETFYASGPAVPLRLSIPLGAYRVQFEGGEASADTDIRDAPETTTAERAHVADRRRTSLVAGMGLAVIVAFVAMALWLWSRPVDPAREPAIVTAPTISIEPGDTVQSVADRARVAEVARRIGTAFTRSGVATVMYGGGSVDSRYALLLDLGTDGTSMSLRLIDRRTGTLEWGDLATLPADPAAPADAIAPYISALVRPSGVLAARQRAALADDYRPGYPCMLHYDRYFRDRTPELREPVGACVARMIALDPDNAAALTAASFIAVDPAKAPISEAARKNGLALARRAATADPYSPAALLAEARIAFMESNCTRGSALASRAVDLDRYDPETLGLAGMFLAQCDRARALEMLRAARKLDPDLTTFYVSALVMLEFDAGRSAEASAIADAMRPPGVGMMRQYLIAQILGQIAAGRNDKAQALWRELVTLNPQPRGTVNEVLVHSYLAPGFRAMLVEKLKLGGIDDSKVMSPE